MINRKLLGIYLNDHLAGSTAGMEVAKRSARLEQGHRLRGLPAQAGQGDRAGPRRASGTSCAALEFGEDIPKKVGAWMFEKVGRLKPNGQLTGYSPLSRVVELEGLALGVTGKLGLWKALRELVDEEPRLDAAELDRLRERAERQQAELEEHRLRATGEAFRS